MSHMQEFINSLKGKSGRQLDHIAWGYAKKGDLEKVKFLLTSPSIENNVNISENDDVMLISACMSGNLELVRYLLTSPELKKHSNINAQDDSPLGAACTYGHLEIVKYLLESPELKKHSKVPFVNTYTENPIVLSAKYEHLEIFKYLISFAEKRDGQLLNYVFKASNEACSTKDTEFIKSLIKAGKSKNNQILSSILYGIIHGACYKNNLDIIKHIFSSPKLAKNVDIHTDNDAIFLVVLRRARLKNELDIARYFIFDLNIKETENIKNFRLSLNCEEVENMFKIRELSDSLNKDLPVNNNTKRKNKI